MQFVKKWYFFLFTILILLLIGVNIWMGQFESKSSEQGKNPFAIMISKPKNGSPVPDFELSGIKGERVNIGQYKGKAVALNFWATWCAPCLVEMPLLETAVKRHEKDLIVLAINIEEPSGTVEAYIKRGGFTFPVLLDVDGKVANNFGVFAYPATFFIDKEGIIRSQHVGQLDETMLRKNLKTIGIETW